MIWVDGVLVDDDAARISPMDHGLLTGDGVFETLRVYGGVPFAWNRHLARLGHSAEALGLPYRELLIKQRKSTRSFLLGNRALRDQAVRLQVMPMASELAGRRVLLVDEIGRAHV